MTQRQCCKKVLKNDTVLQIVKNKFSFLIIYLTELVNAKQQFEKRN